jgi:NADPH:quinone reductase-like Zn-dependent oxidoreductase
MKAYRIEGFGGVADVVVRDAPVPEPAHGQVLVRMRAACFNARDMMLFAGAFEPASKRGLIPLSDGAGEVAAVGPGVWRVRVGERVMPIFNPDWIAGPFVRGPAAMGRAVTVDGVLAEYVLVGQDELVPVPAHLSFEEAATLPCAAVTAWSALCGYGVLLPGQTVLVQGSGGVSLFALQLAKCFGARVIATTSSPAKVAPLTALGADAVIDTSTTPDWPAELQTLTGGEGADVIVDIAGGAALQKSAAAARENGRISIVGVFEGYPDIGPAFFMKGVVLHPIRVGSRLNFEQMNRAITVNKLRPVIAKIFPFDQFATAAAYFCERAELGKTVIRIA